MRRRRHCVYRPDATADARFRIEAHRACAGRGERPAAAAGQRPAAGSAPGAAGSAAHRLSRDAQEYRRRRRHRHAALRRRRRTVRRVRRRTSDRRQQLSRQRRVPGKIPGARAPYRGAAVRQRRRPGDRARRTRLLDAAAQPEGDRGNTGARPERPPALAVVRGCGAARQRGAVSLRRHGRVHRRRRSHGWRRPGRVLFSRGQYAAAGRARRHRSRHRHRPGRVDAAARRRRAARPCRLPPCTERRCDPGAGICGGSGARLSALERAADRGAPARHAARGCLDRQRHRSTGVLRSDAREADRACADARRGHRAARCRAGRKRNLRHRNQSGVPAHDPAPARLPPRPILHPFPEFAAVQLTHDRGAAARDPQHAAGLAGAPALLGRRCAALRTDGPAGVQARQSTRGQSGGLCRAGADGDRADVEVRLRYTHRFDRRGHARRARWRGDRILARRAGSRRQCAQARTDRERQRPAQLPGALGRLRCAALHGKSRHLRAWPVRRPRRAGATYR